MRDKLQYKIPHVIFKNTKSQRLVSRQIRESLSVEEGSKKASWVEQVIA